MAFALLGADHVLFKGGHGEGAMVRDVLWSDGRIHAIRSAAPGHRHTHGTGCTLATAIACGLAQGMALKDAVQPAHAFVQERSGPRRAWDAVTDRSIISLTLAVAMTCASPFLSITVVACRRRRDDHGLMFGGAAGGEMQDKSRSRR